MSQRRLNAPNASRTARWRASFVPRRQISPLNRIHINQEHASCTFRRGHGGTVESLKSLPVGHGSDHRDRLKALDRVVAQLGIQADVDRMRAHGPSLDGVAVRCGMRRELGAETAARTRTVLDDESHAQRGSPPPITAAQRSYSNVHCAGRIQPVDATHSLNISAGVWKPSVLRGISFNCLAVALT